MLLEVRLGLLVGLLPTVIHASSSSPSGGIAIPLARHASATEATFLPRSVLDGQIERRTSVSHRSSRHVWKTRSLRSDSTYKLMKRGTGQVPLTDYNELLWYGTISVGNPPVDFKVNFDTGSSDLFLPSVNGTKNCDGHKRYDTSASSSARDLGKTFNLTYADSSSVHGELFSDQVALGGLEGVNQTIGSAVEYANGFGSDVFPADGVVGMAFPALSAYATPLIQNLIEQGKIPNAEFGVKLAKTNSELFIGGINTKLFTGELTYVDVTKAAYWQVNLEAIDVDGKDALINLSVIINSGTSFIVGDSTGVQTFYSKINGSKPLGNGYYTVPCNTTNNISFKFAGQSFNMSSETFNLGQLSEGSTDCLAAVVANDIGNNGWVFGAAFMQNVYTVFDVAKQRVGFAKLA